MDRKSQERVLKQAAQRFGVDVSQLSPLAGGHYAQVFEWIQNDQQFVLKISPVESDSELASMHAMLDWLAYLAAHDAHVVRHICSQNGNLIEPIEDDRKTYAVTAAEKLSGVRAETLPMTQWDDALIQKLGQVLGHCHAVAQTYTPPPHLTRRPSWDHAANCFNPIDELTAADALIVEKRAEVLKVIRDLPVVHQDYGLAHMDIHFANFVVNAQMRDIVLIDFDDCAYGWYVMDVAMLLFDLPVVYKAGPRKELLDHFLEEFLKGYRRERDLSEFWIAQLPAFIKLLEIGVYTMLADEYDPVTCKDEWVNTFMGGREQRIREDIPYLD
ncbi:MAG: phosphotransferase [Chloroflexi bacterium]|nr:phosphotransferase [Chloroflexota bacterium]